MVRMMMLMLAMAAVAAEQRPAVLFVGTKPEAVRTWEDWLAAGFEVDARDYGAVRDLAALKPFNVVVVQFVPGVQANGAVQPEQAAFEGAMKAYLEAGGGGVVLAAGSGFSKQHPALQHLLAPYGIAVPEEQITDPDHVFGKVGTLTGCVTTQIAAAPMTAGIQRLGYVGQASRADFIECMVPLVVEDEAAWHVVVRGEATAYSAEGVNPGSSSQMKDTPATYAASPVMAAWREVGKGRLFVHPQNPAFTTATPEVFNNTLWRADDMTAPGAMQNRSFMQQVVRWAAEPTLAGDTFGGFVTDRDFHPDARAILEGRTEPIDWAKIGDLDHIAPEMANQRGLVGAQTSRSGGAHSVAELAGAARAAGLQFLAFTEDLASLTPESWESLKADCDAAGTDDFLAIPGILALDKVGNTWFTLGWVPWPEPQAVTPDHDRIDNTYMWWAQLFRNRLGGYARVHANPNTWYEMKHCSGVALLTREPGQADDTAYPEYLLSADKAENLIPFAVTRVATPAEIAAQARDLVNVFTGGADADSLRDYVQGTGRFKKSLVWAVPHDWYVSRGPRLVRHGGYNLGNLATNEELENVYRYGFRLAGLAAGDVVELYDGPALFRQWRVTGPDLVVDHIWPHEQVRDFVLRVRRGDTFVLVGAPVRTHYGRRFMQCGDRQNTLPYNYQPDRHGNVYVSGIPVGAHYRSWAPTTLVYGNFKIWLTGAVGIEYQPPMYMSFWTTPYFAFASDRVEAGESLASYQYPQLSCPGIIIVDEITNRCYPDGGRHLGDCNPPKLTEPTQLLRLTQRRYGIYGMLDQVNGQLVETRVEALADIALKGPSNLVSRFNMPMVAGEGKWAEFHTADRRERVTFDAPPRLTLTDPLEPGDYVGIYPQGLAGGGAQYAVRGDLESTVDTRRGDHFNALWKLRTPTAWKAGDAFDFAILYTTGGSVPYEPSSTYARVVDFLGLATGEFPAIAELTGGELSPEPVIATIAMAPAAALRLRTVVDPAAPLGLPIRVRGLQANWQVVYRLDGSPRWRFCGELEGDQYFHLYTNQVPHEVLLGHPVLADRPEAVIRLDDPAGAQQVFEVYNPTDEPLPVQLRTNPDFLPAAQRAVTVPPYTSVRVDF